MQLLVSIGEPDVLAVCIAGCRPAANLFWCKAWHAQRSEDKSQGSSSKAHVTQDHVLTKDVHTDSQRGLQPNCKNSRRLKGTRVNARGNGQGQRATEENTEVLTSAWGAGAGAASLDDMIMNSIGVAGGQAGADPLLPQSGAALVTNGSLQGSCTV